VSRVSGNGGRRLESVLDAVGNTPLVRLRNVAREAPDVEVWAKLEFANPGGSVKDRPALRMITDALADGRLTRDKILIDSTSGNTGVAYSLFGAALGVRIRLVMPSNVSKARKDIAKSFGTEIVYSDPMEGSDGAIRLARDMVAKDRDTYFYPDQYSNPSNWRAHYDGTGVEILTALGDRITHFVAGLGTTGTMMGTTRRLKTHGRPIECVAVEPADALHGLEGLKHLGSSIVPPIYDPTVPDRILPVTTEDGWDMADRLAREEGLHVGHSSGANVFGAVKIAREVQASGRSGCVVAIICDRGDRYFAPMKWERRYLW
jgi:cysteine synthase B